MQTAKQVHVTITPEGNVTIEGKGFVGKECDKATAAIEQALMAKGETVSKVYKPEANMGSAGVQQQNTARW